MSPQLFAESRRQPAVENQENTMQLQGKIAFITGGGGGIGGGIAQAFAERGMKLVLADVDKHYAETVAAPFGEQAIAVELDVTSLQSWARARDAAHDRFGAVDVLCNNAGVSTPRSALDEMPPELFARVMAVNLTGVYNGIVTCVPEMRARRSGHIVNTSSINGLVAHASLAAYSASKFAVDGLSEALRDELAPFGIGVSVLYPGLTRSRMSLSATSGANTHEIPREVLEANMMEPVWIGRAVARAIEENSPHIISHPGYRPALEARFARIAAAFGEPAQPGYRTGASATRATS
jgi:NAD(P)-dependent dehydrogenase (short-subunit alcohol dehydrogenase family)